MKLSNLWVVLFFVLVLVFSGCAPQKMVTSDAPEGATDTPGADQLLSKSGEETNNSQIFLNDSASPETGKVKPPVEIEMTASQWKFEPSTITVKKGDRVVLKIKSNDVTHGFNLPAFNINENIPSGEVVTVDFVANKVGEFEFACSVYCGQGHDAMKGKLIVEE